jgi:hypothetical protein
MCSGERGLTGVSPPPRHDPKACMEQWGGRLGHTARRHKHPRHCVRIFALSHHALRPVASRSSPCLITLFALSHPCRITPSVPSHTLARIFTLCSSGCTVILFGRPFRSRHWQPGWPRDLPGDLPGPAAVGYWTVTVCEQRYSRRLLD